MGRRPWTTWLVQVKLWLCSRLVLWSQFAVGHHWIFGLLTTGNEPTHDPAQWHLHHFCQKHKLIYTESNIVQSAVDDIVICLCALYGWCLSQKLKIVVFLSVWETEVDFGDMVCLSMKEMDVDRIQLLMRLLLQGQNPKWQISIKMIGGKWTLIVSTSSMFC